MQNVDILHVDDDPHCVELMRRALSKLPHSLDYQAVADGEAALAFLAGQPRLPRLLLLDLNLPKVSGLQVLETLRNGEHNRAMPVVMFTSSLEPQDVQLSYRLGANSYVVKPLEYKDFLATVHQLIGYWFTLNHQE